MLSNVNLETINTTVMVVNAILIIAILFMQGPPGGSRRVWLWHEAGGRVLLADVEQRGGLPAVLKVLHQIPSVSGGNVQE